MGELMDKSRFRLKVAKLWLKGETWADRCPSNSARRTLETHPDAGCKHRWNCSDCALILPELADTMEAGGMLSKCPCVALGANWVKTRVKLFTNGELEGI
jgi:hypothetical protein